MSTNPSPEFHEKIEGENNMGTNQKGVDSSIPFKAFSKIPRLRRECVITLKLDGTNAIIHVSEDGVVRAGSRTRWITPEDDNAGFARWVAAHADELRALGPGYHYGEWFGRGIAKRHHTVEKSFALFNVARWGESRPACCSVVPILYRGTFSDEAVDAVVASLRRDGHPLVAPGHLPEGVVIWHDAAQQIFKVTLENDHAPKGKVTAVVA